MLDALITLFDNCFYQSYNTRLIRGDAEPVYYPANEECEYHRVIFAHGFFSSALHEVSHWCIAGEERRERVDYGYWYNADGRSLEQQKIFESVEVKPQAIEWMLSKAANIPFRISADNLDGEYTDPTPFKKSVLEQVQFYCDHGLPSRANYFHDQLIEVFNAGYEAASNNFSLSEL